VTLHNGGQGGSLSSGGKRRERIADFKTKKEQKVIAKGEKGRAMQ